MKTKLLSIAAAVCATCGAAKERGPVPVIDGPFWRIGTAPDLGELNAKDMSKQQVVDHGFVKDAAGRWHLWACIRGTNAGRLLYAWEGASITDGELWEQKGISARASAEWGEQAKPGAEHIQAPYFRKVGDTYYCFYNSGGIRYMTSQDGARYERPKV